MSVRTIAVRGIPASRLRVVPRLLAAQRIRPRVNLWARLADDRDLVGVKLLMVAILFLVAMVLEVL